MIDMKKIVILSVAALFAASFCAFAQNNDVLQQAQQQVQEKRDALDNAERAHRQQQAESRRNINAAERQIVHSSAKAFFLNNCIAHLITSIIILS